MKCPNCGQENPAEARFCSNCGTTLAPKIEPASILAIPATHTIEYAGFWIRFAAAIIDNIIVWAVTSVIRMLTLIPMFLKHGWYIFGFPNMFNSGIFCCSFLLYYWLFTGLKGQTPGKMTVRIKVVDKQGNTPDLGCAALREILGKFVSAIALYIGYFWIAGDNEKQGWHDKIASTHVIKSR